jgi:hypothetical protein
MHHARRVPCRPTVVKVAADLPLKLRQLRDALGGVSRPSLFLLALCGLVPAGCSFELCIDEDVVREQLAEAGSPIIGGEPDLENDATLALLLTNDDGSRALCSASMIHRRGAVGYALTAAHCVQGTVDDVLLTRDIAPCLSGQPCGVRYQPIDWRAHPGYIEQYLRNDVAVVRFAIGDAAAPPVVPPAEADDGVVDGDRIELSGFGQIEPGASGTVPFQTRRNHVTVEVASSTEKLLRVDASTGKTACFGDSGGPAYASAPRRVVGVASSSDAECRFFSHYQRVGAFMESFIRPILLEECDDCSGGPPDEGGAPAAPPDEGPPGTAEGGAPSGAPPEDPAPAAPPPDAPGAGSDPGPDPGTDAGALEPGDACVPISLSCDASATVRGSAERALGWMLVLSALFFMRRRPESPAD